MGYDAGDPVDMYKIIDTKTNIVTTDTSMPDLSKQINRQSPIKMDSKKEENTNALNTKRKNGIGIESSNVESKKMKLENKRQGK